MAPLNSPATDPDSGGSSTSGPERTPSAGIPVSEKLEATPPHAPKTGRFRRLLGPFYFTGVFWFRFHLFGVRVLPEFMVAPTVSLFSFIFYVSLGRVRTAIGNNLVAVLGPCSFLERQRRVLRTFRTFSWCLTERYEQFVPNKTFDEKMEGVEEWQQILSDPAGFIIATAHVGNWELASALSVGQAGRTCHIVREQELDEDSQAFVEKLLSKLETGAYQTHFANDNPLMGLELLDALRRGEMVALQADRPRSGGKTFEVDICGLQVPLPIGTAALAQTAEVAIVPVYFFRTGRRKYTSVVRPVIRIPKGVDRRAAAEQAIERLGTEIEWAIRRSPHEWFCFSDLSRRN